MGETEKDKETVTETEMETETENETDSGRASKRMNEGGRYHRGKSGRPDVSER